MNRVPQYDSLSFGENALKLRSYRHEVLGSNITNADTPGYKARDIDFRAAMTQASNTQESTHLRATQANHMTGFENQMGVDTDIKYRQPDSFAATFLASLLGANVHFEDKSKNKRFTYLTGLRFRSNQYLLGTLDVQGEYKPRFFDFQTLFKHAIIIVRSVKGLRHLVSGYKIQNCLG